MKDYINKFFIETGTHSVTAPKPIPYDKWPIAWKTIHYKNYPRFPYIKLPVLKPSSELEKVIVSRRSQRNTNRVISCMKLKKLFPSQILPQLSMGAVIEHIHLVAHGTH